MSAAPENGAGQHRPGPARANADELLRAFADRVDDLDAQITALIGKQVDGGRAGVREALGFVSTYPEHMRTRMGEQWARATRPSIKAKLVRTFTADVVNASALVQEWFASPYNDEVPVALLDAITRTCDDLGLRDRSPVVAVGPPTKLDIVVSDVRQDLFAAHGPAPDAGKEFAILTVPRHEGLGPRWWPVVLGHEMAHLKLRLDEENAPPTEPDPTHEDDIASAAGANATYMLRRLDLFSLLPREELSRAVADERAQDRQAPGHADPPGIGPVLPGTHGAAAPPPGTPANAVMQRIVIANDWLVEFTCDIAMVRRYGPAGLAAMGTYLWSVGGFNRLSKTHPVGILRVRIMADYLKATQGEVLSSVLAPWADVDEEMVPESQHPWARIISDFVWDNRQRIYDEVDGWTNDRYAKYDSASPDREVAVMLAQRQLCVGLPPFDSDPNQYPPGNAERRSTGRRGASPGHVRISEADVINAAWAVAMFGTPDPLAERAWRIPVDRLALKALETQQLLDRVGESAPVAPAKPRRPRRWRTGPRRPHDRAAGGAVLGRDAITARLVEQDLWRRLVVTPALPNVVGEANLDVHLGTSFIIFQRTGITSFNAARGMNSRAVQRIVERAWGESFVLHPGEVVLASLLEYVALPIDVSAQVITRSSYGRLGLITATAVQVHPLYRGCLTLELVNLGTVPLQLYPGEAVAQLVFMSADVGPSPKAPTPERLFGARYACPTRPEFPKVTVDEWVKPTDRG